ncbi:MAG: CHAT domain-containing protein [Actinomycetota bacterium]
MRLTANELYRRGVDASNARRFAAARRALAEAERRTDDPDLRARIAGTLSYVLGQVGQPEEAEDLCRRTLRTRGLQAETRAVLQGQLGVLLTHSGRLDEAEAMLSRAIDALPADSAELANCLMNRSIVRMHRHELERCADDLRRAIPVYEALDQHEPLAEAQHNLGYAALLGGDLVTALSLMDRSRPLLASDLARAISDLDRAEVLRDAGLTTEAEALLRRVAAAFGAQRMRQARGEAEFHLARSLLRHDAASAERVARAAVRRFRALGSDGWAARAEAVRVEAAATAHPHRPPPADEFDGAIEDLRRGGFRTEASGLRLTARLSHDGGRLPRVDDDAPTPLRIRSHEVRAELAARRGRDAEARRIAGEGLDLLAGWRRSFGALDLQASFAMHGTRLVRTGLEAASRSDDPALLFDWSERARHLSLQVAPVRPPHDAELAADLRELRLLRGDLAGADWTADARVRMLRDRVRERQWSSTGTAGTRERMTLGAVQARVDDRTAVACYVFTGDALRAVVIRRSGAHIVDVAWSRIPELLDGLRADLDVSALSRGGPMARVVDRALADRLARLDAELLAPVRAAAGSSDRLVITVPGVLGGVPWGMLPSMAAIPFTLATSVSHGVHSLGVPERPRSAGFVAGPRVPRAEEEVRAAAVGWPDAGTLTGAAASVAAVTDLASRVDVLHIAAHGKHAVDNPLFAGFELVDGTLFGYDVDLISRVPSTVVLSACELGRSSLRWGEEALGMTRVWLHAGSDCVIATPVIVSDDVAGAVLGAVHTGLSAGDSPAVALSRAIAESGERVSFQCHGNGF